MLKFVRVSVLTYVHRALVDLAQNTEYRDTWLPFELLTSDTIVCFALNAHDEIVIWAIGE